MKTAIECHSNISTQYAGPLIDLLDTVSENDWVTNVPVLQVVVTKLAKVNNSDTRSYDSETSDDNSRMFDKYLICDKTVNDKMT